MDSGSPHNGSRTTSIVPIRGKSMRTIRTKRFFWVACLIVGLMGVFGAGSRSWADDPVKFDLAGPKVDVQVRRGNITLPIAQVPTLLAGDKLLIKSDLPSTQSNHLLLSVAFLRGTTKEP